MSDGVVFLSLVRSTGASGENQNYPYTGKHRYVRVTVRSEFITFRALSSSFIKHLRQRIKKYFTQRFELRPLQDSGGSGVSKSRINSVVNFWLVWTQAWRAQTVYVWSSWLSSCRIRKRTLLVLSKQTATNSYVTTHHTVRRSRCDMRYSLPGYWRRQYGVHGNVSPRVWYLLHPSVNSICTSQREWIDRSVNDAVSRLYQNHAMRARVKCQVIDWILEWCRRIVK